MAKTKSKTTSVTNTPSKIQDTKTIRTILFVSLLVIVIWAMAQNTPSKPETKVTQPKVEETTTTTPSTTPSVTTTAPVSTPAKAFVTRTDIVRLFPEFSFQKKAPVGGKDNYLAQSSNKLLMIQVIGPENAPDEISISLVYSASTTSETDVNITYKDRLLERLTPSLGMFPSITKDRDTKTVDGFDVVFTTTSLSSSSSFTEAYSFKPTK